MFFIGIQCRWLRVHSITVSQLKACWKPVSNRGTNCCCQVMDMIKTSCDLATNLLKVRVTWVNVSHKNVNTQQSAIWLGDDGDDDMFTLAACSTLLLGTIALLSWFVQTGNSAIKSAVPENPTLEPNMEWIGRPVAEIWPFEIFPRWRRPPSWIFSNQK